MSDETKEVKMPKALKNKEGRFFLPTSHLMRNKVKLGLEEVSTLPPELGGTKAGATNRTRRDKIESGEE